MLFLVISLTIGTTLSLADNSKSPAHSLQFGQVYGTAVFLNSDQTGTTTDAADAVLTFTATDGHRNLVLANKAGDFIALLEPGRYCISVYQRTGEPLELTEKQMKCIEVGAGKDVRLDVMLVSPKH